MSSIPLTDIQEIIERSLFERLRQEIVDKGYLPDISIYPDNQAGYDSYLSDKEVIISSKGFAIDIFNSGTNFSKGIKQIPRIIIKTGNFLPGDIGGDPKKFFELQVDDTYIAKVTPPQTSDFYLNIHLVTNSTQQDRVLNSLLALFNS